MAETQGERLSQIIEHLGFSQRNFAIELSVSQAFISKMTNNNNQLSKNFIDKLLSYFEATNFNKKLNINWLITGEGSMFIQQAIDIDSEIGKSNVTVSNLAANASPGIASQYVELSSRAYLPMVRNGAVAFPIQGKSMIPVFDDGDWLLCYELERVEDVKSGSIYVIRTSEGVLLCKYIIKKGTKWELVSENTSNFGVISIEVEDINKVFRIEKVLTSRYGWEN